jgi:putative tryptophan/tyrosine transport system substrate-binding protein
MTTIALLITLALGLLGVRLAAEAQPSAKVARIGYLSVGGGAGSPLTEAFRQGLHELGYVEGQNIAIEFRAAEGSDRLPALAAELVQLPVDVLVALGTQAAQAAKHTTTTVPIVMVVDADPVATGLVASLARPGGNLTGLTTVPRGWVANG